MVQALEEYAEQNSLRIFTPFDSGAGKILCHSEEEMMLIYGELISKEKEEDLKFYATDIYIIEPHADMLIQKLQKLPSKHRICPELQKEIRITI